MSEHEKGCLRPSVRIRGTNIAEGRTLRVVQGGTQGTLALQSLSFLSTVPTAGGFGTEMRRLTISWVPADGPIADIDTTLERYFIQAPTITASFTVVFPQPWLVPVDSAGNEPMVIRIDIGGGNAGAIWQVNAQMVRALDIAGPSPMKRGG